MTLTKHAKGPLVRPVLAVLALSAASFLLVGCGDKKDKSTQVAARVNKDEITVHQIDFILRQQRNLPASQVDAASRQILERLIDQQLELGKAQDLKLDRDPLVLQQLEAAQREILARAYQERVAAAATKPSADEIQKYYDDKPALFSQRRIYSLQELNIQAKPDQVATLRERLASSKSINEFADYLKANDFRFSAGQAVRAAEELPLASLNTFAKMNDGQAMLVPAAAGVQVIVLAGSRSQPVTAEQARPAIEQFILNDRRRKLVEDDVKQLRAAAKIQYEGQFATPAASAPAATPDAGPAATSGTTGTTAAPSAPASGGLSATDISKGLGLK